MGKMSPPPPGSLGRFLERLRLCVARPLAAISGRFSPGRIGGGLFSRSSSLSLDLAPVSPRAVGLVGMAQPPTTQLFVRLRPESPPLSGRLYGIVAGVDPTLRLSEVGTAADEWGAVHTGARLGAWVFMAVGAPRGQIMKTVFGRAAFQLLGGVALGGLVAVPVLWDGVVDEGPRSLVIVSVLLLGAGLAACLVPVRRALAIPPAAAIKSE